MSGHAVTLSDRPPEIEARTPAGFESLLAPWSLLAADAEPDRVELHWITVRRAGHLRAAGVAHVVRGLALGDYTGGRIARLTAVGRRLGHVPLSFDIAYLEIPLANREGLTFAPDVDAGERAEIVRRVVAALDRALPVDAICVKASADQPAGGCEGLATLPFIERNLLELPGDPPSAEAWLAARSCRRRSSIRSNRRAFAAAGAELSTLDDPAAHAERLAELHRRTAAHARAAGSLPLPIDVTAAFFRRFHARLGDRGLVRVARIGADIVAFSAVLRDHDTLYMRHIGLDYERSTTSCAYFNQFYDAIELAAAHGLRYVDMGTGTSHVKQPLGARPIATRYHVRFRRLLRPIGGLIARLLERRFSASPEPR